MTLARRLMNLVLGSRKCTKGLQPRTPSRCLTRPLALEILENRRCPVLTLTQAGINAGIGISIFAVDVPSILGNAGPTGIAFPDSGGVLVADGPGNVRTFPTDTDGQSAAWFNPGQSYGEYNAFGMAKIGSNLYMAQINAGRIIQINDDGTFNQSIVDIPGVVGLVANPTTGRLFASGNPGGNPGIADVDPVAQTMTVFTTGQFDGLTLSADGTTLYAARRNDNHVIGFSVSNGNVVFDSGAIPDMPDGVAEGTGPLSGNLFVNTNNGTVIQIDLSTLSQTVIASNGSRGDFVTLDLNDGSVFFTQTDRIVRLRFPAASSGRHKNPIGDPDLAWVDEPGHTAAIPSPAVLPKGVGGFTVQLSPENSRPDFSLFEGKHSSRLTSVAHDTRDFLLEGWNELFPETSVLGSAK